MLFRSDYLAKMGEKTNITTIYRRLDKLIAEKKVIRHSAGDGKKGLFQYIADDSDCLRHLHIQCTGCSKIIHLDCKISKDFADHLAEDHGIQLDYQKTVLYGLCNECRAKEKK